MQTGKAMNDNIYKQAAQHVTRMFEDHHNPALVYHSIDHTKNVVEKAEEIAAHYQLSEREMLIIYIAAWFHDTGHLFTDIVGHEDKSIDLMREFMQGRIEDETLVQEIADCIMATHMPHVPHNRLQEIMCDADTYHFGTKDFKITNKQVREELKLRNFTAPLKEWEKNTLELLKQHKYFTSYCQQLLAAGKQKNIDRAARKLAEVQPTMPNKKESKEKISAEEKQQHSLVARGIQTMLRLTSENHLELSNMADGKANILISVNAIIISIILSVLVRKLEVEPYLTIPTLMFLGFSVITIVIAILATRPSITEGKFTREDVLNKKTNLLFFGNFYKSTMADYEWAMGSLMQDKDYLYNSLVRDIYYLGVVLGRKYKLIRLAYTVFMVGIVLSVIAFLVATLFAAPREVTTVSMPANTPL